MAPIPRSSATSANDDSTTPPPPAAPTPLGRLWVRYLLGFGVSVGIGLAPYLGRVNVPGFTPLLRLLPESEQDVLIPLSSALMGLTAVVVQYYGQTRVSRPWLERAFVRTLGLTVFSFLLLFVVHTFVVVRVDLHGGKDYVRFVVGFTRPEMKPCTAEVSDADCIKAVSMSQSAIESFWGDTRIRVARLCLMLSYLAFTSLFGLLVGLLLLGQSLGSTIHGGPRGPG